VAEGPAWERAEVRVSVLRTSPLTDLTNARTVMAKDGVLVMMLLLVGVTIYLLLIELPRRGSAAALPHRIPAPTTLVNQGSSSSTSSSDPLLERKTAVLQALGKGTDQVTSAAAGAAAAAAAASSDASSSTAATAHQEHLNAELGSDKWVSWKNMDQVRYLTLLTAASIASSVVCHPLHVIMMRQQVGAMTASGGLSGVYRSLQEAIASIGIQVPTPYYPLGPTPNTCLIQASSHQPLIIILPTATRGLQGLFRGWIPLMLEAPSHALYFSVTESSREFLQVVLRYPFLLPGAAAPMVLPTMVVDMTQSFLSAFIANAVSLVPWVPAEILSAKLAIQSGGAAMGMSGMIRHIWRTEGLGGFFKGFMSSLVCHVTYSFLWWASYSTTRRQVAHFFPTMAANHTILYDAVTGILAGVASGVMNHPLDTIKLRIQTGYEGGHMHADVDLEASTTGTKGHPDGAHDAIATASIIAVARQIIRQEGVVALFHGVSSMVYSTIFSSAAFCIIYEMIKRQSIMPLPEETSSAAAAGAGGGTVVGGSSGGSSGRRGGSAPARTAAAGAANIAAASAAASGHRKLADVPAHDSDSPSLDAASLLPRRRQPWHGVFD